MPCERTVTIQVSGGSADIKEDIAELIRNQPNNQKENFMEESLGQYLKRVRIEKGYGLRDVTLYTRIGPGHLEALEAENYAKLPPETVAKSYVRTYARYLRVDEGNVMKRFAESAGVFYRDKETAARAAKLASASNPLKSTLNEFVSNIKLLF